MEIPGSGIVNRYIAAQGPLPNTCRDFWQMIWEQQCRLVVMLTTKVTNAGSYWSTIGRLLLALVPDPGGDSALAFSMVTTSEGSNWTGKVKKDVGLAKRPSLSCIAAQNVQFLAKEFSPEVVRLQSIAVGSSWLCGHRLLNQSLWSSLP